MARRPHHAPSEEMAADGEDVEAVDFELDDDELMDEDGAVEVDASPLASHPKIRSTITDGAPSFGPGNPSGAPKKTKGRGFRDKAAAVRNSWFAGWEFHSLDSDGGPGAQRSIEGWIVLVTGLHEEEHEDDLHNVFGEFGQVKNLHLNLDRRTGFVKGYALIEYENYNEAHAAISTLNGTKLLTQMIYVDWAFSNAPYKVECEDKVTSRSPLEKEPGEETLRLC